MKKVTIPSSLLLVTMAGMIAPQIWAEDTAKQESVSPTVKECKTPRLMPYESNYMVYRSANNDEDALRVHYSLRYMLYPFQNDTDVVAKSGEACRTPNNPSSEWYFKYTGDFDFYQGTRPSSPGLPA